MQQQDLNIKIILEQIQCTQDYQTGINFGEVAIGHPEGKLINHIAQLENNLSKIEHLLTTDQVDRLRLLIHTHDMFKFKSVKNVPVKSSRSHPALAAEFLKNYTEENDLINIARFHDTPFAAWCDHAYRGIDSHEDFDQALQSMQDHNLFALFLLIDGLTEGKHTTPLEWSINRICQLKAISPVVIEAFGILKTVARNEFEKHNPVIPIQTPKKFKDIEHITLGPIETWGAKILIPLTSMDKIRDILQAVSDRENRRIPCVISNTEYETCIHLSRYPRRPGVAVPAISDFEEGFDSLQRALKDSGIKVTKAYQETTAFEPGMQRATIGLTAGYSEARKNAFLLLVDSGDIKSFEEAKVLIEGQINLMAFNIDLKSYKNLEELTYDLRNRSFSRTFTTNDLALLDLKTSALTIQEARIISVAPKNYLYEEDCLVLMGKGSEAREQIFKIADAFQQARFVFESLSAKETVNIELPKYSAEKAAQMV